MNPQATPILLNCDMGESFGSWKIGDDEKIMPHIDLANLACGFHASDPLTIDKTVQLALKYNVTIGAHPSYQDLVGFGRRSIKCSPKEIETMVLYQIGALNAFCLKHKTKLTYVKPHGALYNDMMKNKTIFESILKAVSIHKLKLMVLSTSNNKEYETLAKEYKTELLFEAFGDRNYDKSGTLVCRTLPNSVITDTKQVINRIQTLQKDGYIESIEGEKLFLPVDTLCVHGDNEKALFFIKECKKLLAV